MIGKTRVFAACTLWGYRVGDGFSEGGRYPMAPVQYQEGRFPPDGRLDWPRLVPLIGPASAAVARYDGMLSGVPNPRILLAPLSRREAERSSRIEGTQATIGEVLEFEARGKASSPARRDDILEVIQYRMAMEHAENMLDELPLSQRVIRESHRVLLSRGRGRHRSPGAYRRNQNFIGPAGCSIEEATFVPVGAGKLLDAMVAWERYMHQDHPDRLVQLAILHAEFEALHPFHDGNGRMGRMLVPLFMWQIGLMRQPAFFISPYMEANRQAYYEGLLSVSRDDNWTGWCRFFLDAVRIQAEDNLARAQAILDLHEEMKGRVPDVTRTQYAAEVLDWMFERPIFSSVQLARETALSAPTARRILRRLCDADILHEAVPGRGRRPGLFVFPRLLRVAEGSEPMKPKDRNE